MLLRGRGPRQQLCSLRLVELVVAVKNAGRALDDHAPALLDVVVVGFEQALIVDRGTYQLGSLSSAQQHRATLHDEVHRKELRLTIDASDNPAERLNGQQIPAFMRGQDGGRVTRCR